MFAIKGILCKYFFENFILYILLYNEMGARLQYIIFWEINCYRSKYRFNFVPS